MCWLGAPSSSAPADTLVRPISSLSLSLPLSLAHSRVRARSLTLYLSLFRSLALSLTHSLFALSLALPRGSFSVLPARVVALNQRWIYSRAPSSTSGECERERQEVTSPLPSTPPPHTLCCIGAVDQIGSSHLFFSRGSTIQYCTAWLPGSNRTNA